ncbi:MAG: hypothetical protein ACYDBT_03740 [Desulfobulbaceae bacterium]
MRRQCFAAGAGLFLFVLLLSPGRCPALYRYSGEEFGLSVSAAVNAGLGVSVNPEDTPLYAERKDVLWSGDLRLLADGYAGERLRGQLNILQNIRTAASVSLPSGFMPSDVERSALFSRQEHESGNTRADLVLDTGSLTWGTESNGLTLGRQPVQFTVTSSFSPNDFFAPFAPQQFYRVYKPGVDALRYEHRLADLTQFSLVGVLGYEEDPDSENGWRREPDWERTSVLGRYVRSAGRLEWGVLAGVVREDNIVGASLQGELNDWLGLRAEGHYRDSHQDALADGVMFSAGLEHRFASSLTMRLEQMYNSFGYSSIEDADRAFAEGRIAPGYLGRNYSAFAASYEFSPLLTGELLYLRNWTDSSHSFSFYAVYSLADEAELALQITLPEGDEPDSRSLGSELGMQPLRAALEYRHYF